MAAKICILVGSVREDSHSLRIAEKLKTQLSTAGHQTETIDPRQMRLPIPFSSDDSGSSKALGSEMQQRIARADAVIFVTPEYDGSYSAVSKVIIEMLGYPSALAGKAVSVIGVATGSIGAYRAIEHLRAVLLHIGAHVCPSALSVGEVHKIFGGAEESKFDQRLVKHAEELLQFSGA